MIINSIKFYKKRLIEVKKKVEKGNGYQNRWIWLSKRGLYIAGSILN